MIIYLYLLITVMLFSSIEIMTVFIQGSIHPMTLTAMRFFIGGVTLLPLALYVQRQKEIRLQKKDFLTFAYLGALLCGIAMVALQFSIFLGKASTTAILISANPVFVTLYGLVWFKEKVTPQNIATLIIGMIGICLISFSPGQGDTPIGVLLGLVATITFAAYTVLNKRKGEDVPSIVAVAYSFLFGSLICLPVIFLLDGGWTLTLDVRGWMIMVYLGMCATGIAYAFYFKALETLSASVGSLVFFVKPVVASILAYVLLGDLITIRKMVGVVLILISLSLPYIQKRRIQPQIGSPIEKING